MKKEQNILKKAGIKRILSERGFRISNKNIEMLLVMISKLNKDILEKVIRNARISGRKTIKKEDIYE